jgi:hypothetical protein
MKAKLIGFVVEVFDLVVYLILWASLWYVYDYFIEKYIGSANELKTVKFNVAVFILGIFVLLLRNMTIYKYNPF